MSNMAQRRLPPNLFAIPFGVAGLAEVWDAARTPLGTPAAVTNVWSVLAAALWAVVLVPYSAKGPRLVLADLRDRIVAPFVALALITPMLLASSLYPYAAGASRVLVVVLFVLLLVLGGWLTGQWIAGDLDNDAVHPGYFLPTVAGGLVGAYALAAVDLHSLAEVSFGIGMLCWLLLGSLLLNRLFFRPSLPPPLFPTLAIEVAPPAVAGIAYFALSANAANTFSCALAGYTILMVLVQLRLIPLYARLHFSPGFWSFTFPYAAVATYGLGWIARKQPAGGTAYAVVLVAAPTALVLAVGLRSLVAVKRHQFLPAPLSSPAATDQPQTDRLPSHA